MKSPQVLIVMAILSAILAYGVTIFLALFNLHPSMFWTGVAIFLLLCLG